MLTYPGLAQLETYIPAGEPTNLRTLQLAAWYWIVNVAHLHYDNAGGNRCGEHGFIDCSGGVALSFNIAFVAMGLPAPFTCEATNSYSLARDCFNPPRPQWMIDQFGDDLPGTFVPLGAAMDMPGALGFHGSNWGMSPDANGDGHVKDAYYGHDVSVEAMSHAAGVGFSVFLNGAFIGFAAVHPLLLPFFAPAPVVEEVDMLIEQFAGFPAIGTNQPIAQFVPADPVLFPHGAVILRYGLRIKGDLKTTNPNTHIWVAQFQAGGGTKWMSMTKKPNSSGLTLIDDKGNTSAPDQGVLVLPVAA